LILIYKFPNNRIWCIIILEHLSNVSYWYSRQFWFDERDDLRNMKNHLLMSNSAHCTDPIRKEEKNQLFYGKTLILSSVQMLL